MTLRQVNRRPAFTLIELMVVIGIIIILATLAVLFLPNLDRNKGVPNGVTQLHGWINLAKMQAIRDGAARGVRLIPDPNNPSRVTALEYIEQPAPLAPIGPGMKVHFRTWFPVYDPVLFPGAPPNAGQLTVATLYHDPANQYQPAPNTTPPEIMWRNWEGVEIGDSFQITGSPNQFASVRRFTLPPLPPPAGPPPPPALPGKGRSQLILDRVIEGTELRPVNGVPTGNVLIVGNNFRVIRQPRPLVGEPILQLHKDVYIDLTACHPCPPHLAGAKAFPPNTQYPSPPFPQWQGMAAWSPYLDQTTALPYLDILFNSTGVVANAPYGQIILFVRHVDRPNDILLLSINTRTGKVAPYSYFDLYEAGPGQFDPYDLARKGTAPGL